MVNEAVKCTISHSQNSEVKVKANLTLNEPNQRAIRWPQIEFITSDYYCCKLKMTRDRYKTILKALQRFIMIWKVWRNTVWSGSITRIYFTGHWPHQEETKQRFMTRPVSHKMYPRLIMYDNCERKPSSMHKSLQFLLFCDCAECYVLV